MQCLNVKNKEVAALLNEYAKILGSEDAAYYVLSENNGYGLDKAPNGADSKLFSDLLAYYNGDKNKAILTKSKIFTKEFKDKFKDTEPKITDIIPNAVIEKEVIKLPKVITSTYNKIMSGLERRIADIEHSKFKGNRENVLRRLQFRLNQVENDKATLEFVDYLLDDVVTQKTELKNMLDAYRLYKKNGTPHNITQEQLDIIRKGFIGFYNTLITNLQNMLDDESTFAHFDDEKLIEQAQDSVRYALGEFNEAVRLFNNIVDGIAKDSLIEDASKISNFTKAELERIIDEGDFDINWWERYIGQTQYTNNALVQLLLNKLVNVKNAVNESELEVGKKLLNLADDVDMSEVTKLFQERGRDGKRTGFLTSALNRGQHQKDYLEFLRGLAKDLGYENEDIYKIPELLSDEEYRYWNEQVNKWDAKHTERKFIPEYYEITNILSLEAKRRRDDINNEIQIILLPTIDEDGFSHVENLSDEDYTKLQSLEMERRNLSNPFYSDGTEKLGIDKQIALEFQEYNKRLRDKLEYKTNWERFKKAHEKAKKLPKDKYKKWVQRNTVLRITQAFYDEVAKLSSGRVKSKLQLEIEEARNYLLKLYTKPDGEIDIDSIPTSVKSMIATYDKMIQEQTMKSEKLKKSEVYQIAEWEVNPKYKQMLEYYRNRSESEYTVWLSQNTYTDAYGNIQPAAFWKKLVPKEEFKKYYMERVPNRTWSEVSKESAFYNPNFDESYGESRIPKKSLYANNNYQKIVNNPKLKALYDEVLNTMKEANSNIYFARFSNPYKLPQIDGGAWNKITRSDNVLKGLGLALSESVTVQEKDEKYNIQKALRTDGTAVKLVPTRYMKMLDDPNMITDDVIGSVIHYHKMATNYKKMSEIAPEMETILDFAGRMEVKTKEGEILDTKSTKLYSKINDMINMFVYGADTNPSEIKLLGKKISIDKLFSHLANYTRKVGIAQNINVILTGLVTNKVMNRLEAISGLHFDNSELRAASTIIQKEYASALLGVGKALNKNKLLCFLEYTGTVRDNERTFKDLNKNRLTRFLNQHFWYFGHEISDFITKGKMVIAIALHSRYVPSQGKFMTKNEFFRMYNNKKEAKAAWKSLNTTLYDAFEVKNNLLVVKDEFKDKLDESTINKFKNTCKQVGTRIDTQLTDLDKNWIQQNALGKLLFIYRNFLIIGIQNKFMTKPQFNVVSGLYQDAQFHAAYRAIASYFSKDKLEQLRELYKENFDEVNEYNKAMLRRVTAEILSGYVLFFILSVIFRGMADDDKDDFLKNEAALIGTRAGIELRSNLLPIEAISLFSNPTAAWSTLQYFGEMATAPFNDPMEEITKGPYKGMYRYQRSLIKATPLRNIYELKDPRSKLQYYNNFSLF